MQSVRRTRIRCFSSGDGADSAYASELARMKSESVIFFRVAGVPIRLDLRLDHQWLPSEHQPVEKNADFGTVPVHRPYGHLVSRAADRIEIERRVHPAELPAQIERSVKGRAARADAVVRNVTVRIAVK